MAGTGNISRLVLGCDHGGYILKEAIRMHAESIGMDIVDCSPSYANPMDYCRSASDVCRVVLAGPGALGILCCGTGVGMSIAANRFPGIRAALLYDDVSAEFSRRHNEANVLAFGERTMAVADVLRRVDIFLSHRFEGGKYGMRNASLDEF